MRLYKYVKTYGNYTEKETRNLYQENKIKVNNKLVPYSWKLNDNDIVTIDDLVLEKHPFVYYLYYKPLGVRCDIVNSPDSYLNHLNLNVKVMPAGRLDKDSEGLLILTNDGKFISYLNDPLNNITKEYIVLLKEKVTSEFLNNITKPIMIKGKLTKPMLVTKIDDYTISLTLQDGRYHQIRRSVILNNNRVINLKRIRIGKYKLNDLNPNELQEIKMY